MTPFVSSCLRRLAPATVLLVLGACGGASDDPASAPRPEKKVVTIEGIAFEPGELTVQVGETVEWLNKDEVDHTVTSGDPGEQGVPGVDKGTPPEPDGYFDEPLKRAGAMTSFTFDERGTFDYFCRVHASMTGVITVE